MSHSRDFTPYDSRIVRPVDPARRAFPKSWGAEYLGDSRTLFRLWAPELERLRLKIEGRNREMLPAGQGWFTLTVEGAAPGSRYQFVMPDGKAMADPASRAQIGGIDGPSVVIDPASYRWSLPAWRGHAWKDAVLYEMHLGTFTAEGTFRAAIGKLGAIAALGVTMIQLMPVNQFPGDRGWGYDGVLPYAPHHAYGQPEEMKAFVDAAHDFGLSVLLNVVYDHIGPEGCLLDAYVPSFFDPEPSPRQRPAIAYSQPAVRSFFIENALYWLEEYNLDGLRLGAADQIRDEGSERPVLVELAERVRAETTGRRRHLVIEDQRNLTAHVEAGASGAYEAVCNPDIQHAAHVAATGEASGHAVPFAERPVRMLARGLAEGFVYQGEATTDGKIRGERSGHLIPTAFVNFLQDPAQIGNRVHGERLVTLAGERRTRVLNAILLLSPQVPMLFMGDEWPVGRGLDSGSETAEAQPFLFFCDYRGALAEAVRAERVRTLTEFGSLPAGGAPALDLADPNDPSVFTRSKLRWERRGGADEGSMLALLRDLIALRKAEITPLLGAVPADGAPYCGTVLASDEAIIAVDWQFGDRILQLRANLGEAEGRAAPAAGRILHREPGSHIRLGEVGGETVLPGWSMVMAIRRADGIHA